MLGVNSGSPLQLHHKLLNEMFHTLNTPLESPPDFIASVTDTLLHQVEQVLITIFLRRRDTAQDKGAK